MRVIVSFDADWVLQHAQEEVLPVDAVVQYITDRNLGAVLHQDFTEAQIMLAANVCQQVTDFWEELFQYICQVFRLNTAEAAAVCKLTVWDEEPQEEEKAPEPEEASEWEKELEKELEEGPAKEPAPKMPEPPRDSSPRPPRRPRFTPEAPKDDGIVAMDRIRTLHGAEQFIALCESIHQMAPVLRQRKLEGVCTSLSYLFSIDNGCGHTTAVELLSRLLTQESLFEGKLPPREVVLEAANPQSDPLHTAIMNIHSCKNRVVSIDISNWCDKVASPEFRDFLVKLRNLPEGLVFVFRVPYLEHVVLQNIEDALSDVMRIQKVVFPPMAAADLQTIAREKLEEKGFTATSAAWELFQHRLAAEKSDGRFYGIRTVENIVEDMIFLKVQALVAGMAGEDTVIDAPELVRLAGELIPSLSAEELLNKMVGMDKLRQKIYEFVNQLEFAKKRDGITVPSMHMRFVGNPGTGKTTVARILGQLMKERGLLSKGFFFEHAGGDFIGMYVGHTAPKTLALCRDAYGSVLFIDEAYTLANANYRDNSGYAKEAVDTLIAQMENHRDDMMVIMAGYPQDMERLMALNPGLSGRMPFVLEFPNYTRGELAQIFLSMAEKSAFTLSAEAQAAAEDYFEHLDDSILNAPDFSNARFVRNLFERTWSKTVTRSQFDKSDLCLITRADFDAAVAECAQMAQTKAVRRARPGYHVGLI